ncbi:MAG: hypothetical protein AAFR84_07955 [Pseudomonadota bacterium]
MPVKLDANVNYNTLRQTMLNQIERNGGKTDGIRLNSKNQLYAKKRTNIISFSSKASRNAKYEGAANAIKASINREFEGQKIGNKDIGDHVFQQLGNPKKIDLATLKQIDLAIASAVKQASQNSGDDVQRMADHYGLLVDANHEDMGKQDPLITHGHLSQWKNVVTGREEMRQAITKDLARFPGNHDAGALADKMLLDTEANAHGLTWLTFNRSLTEVGKLFNNPNLNMRTAMPNLWNLMDTLATKNQAILNGREAKAQDTALDKCLDRNPSLMDHQTGPNQKFGVALDFALVARSKLLGDYATVARQNKNQNPQEIAQLRTDLTNHAANLRALAASVPTTLDDLGITLDSYKEMSTEAQQSVRKTLSANGDVAQTLRDMATSTRSMALSLTSYSERALDLNTRPIMSTQAEVQGNSGLNQTSPQQLFTDRQLINPKLIVKGSGADILKNQQIQMQGDAYADQVAEVNLALEKYQASGTRQDLQTLARSVEDALMSNTDMTRLTSGKTRSAKQQDTPSNQDKAMISNTSLLKAQAKGLRALREMITVQNDKDRLANPQIVQKPMQNLANVVLPPQPKVASDQELYAKGTGMEGERPYLDSVSEFSDEIEQNLEDAIGDKVADATSSISSASRKNSLIKDEIVTTGGPDDGDDMYENPDLNHEVAMSENSATPNKPNAPMDNKGGLGLIGENYIQDMSQNDSIHNDGLNSSVSDDVNSEIGSNVGRMIQNDGNDNEISKQEIKNKPKESADQNGNFNDDGFMLQEDNIDLANQDEQDIWNIVNEEAGREDGFAGLKKMFEADRPVFAQEMQNKAESAERKKVENNELLDAVEQAFIPPAYTMGNNGEIDPDISVHETKDGEFDDDDTNSSIDDIDHLNNLSINNNNQKTEGNATLIHNVDIAINEDIDSDNIGDDEIALKSNEGFIDEEPLEEPETLQFHEEANIVDDDGDDDNILNAGKDGLDIDSEMQDDTIDVSGEIDDKQKPL